MEEDVAKLVENVESHIPDNKGKSDQLYQVVSPEWWGFKRGFVSGGFLGAEARRRKSIEKTQNDDRRAAFHEEDQENLYKLVQNKATSGKQGLGIKGRAKKIAGCYFQGKKTSFDDSDVEDSTDSKRDELLEVEHDENSKVKLKKLCRQLIRQAPGESLKLKQLKVLIDEHSSNVFSHFSSKKEALIFLKHKLQGSDKFFVEGKRVSLSVKNLE
ncbi:hypothetical protein ACH5RR_038390 [Cinchona calisaya]|uniref:Cell growth-regulating nucleolar protein-like winged helix domain-containing protein n=1 Tax=Cinchona calisaya TaxID=153742 RepID=A0ABD2XYF9_9GENT